jgi:hypothetical protein
VGGGDDEEGPYYSTIIPNPACRVEDIIGSNSSGGIRLE